MRVASKINGGSTDFTSDNPGRDVQRVGTARFLGEDVSKIHDPVWAVIGTLGESQCYLGVSAKVAAVQAALSRRIARDEMRVRLVAPAFTLGVSDGQLNGTARMRYSLIGRELVHDTTEIHLRANDVAGAIAVVACDKPPVGAVAALLEHNAPTVVFSDGSIRPGTDPETCERLDLVGAFQAASDLTSSDERASPSTVAPATAAAAACTPTTRCRRSSRRSAWNPSTWLRRHLMTFGASPRSPTSSSTASLR